MAYVTGLLVLLLGLLVSIALHELGHMIPAKRFGVRVSRYMVGFGPTLWSRTRGETEYGLKAIPLGGYVRLIGMFPPAHVVGARPRAGRVAELVAEAREAGAAEIRPGEEHRAFYRLSTPRKVVVMLGGPMMNLLLAAVLLALVLVGLGVPAGPSTTVVSVGTCVLPADAPADRECTEADPPAPAAAAGLEPGDRLLSYGGRATPTWDDFAAAVRTPAGQDLRLVVERGGQEVTLRVSPVTTERPVLDEDGVPVTDGTGEVRTEQTRFIGVGPGRERERQPISAVPPLVGSAVWETGKVVVTLPVRLVEVTQAALGLTERGSGVVGVVGVARFSGEIASAEGLTVTDRAAASLTLLATLNVALFVFNLIPLLPLDGGHVAAALWEGAKRRWASARGLPRPAPADVARMMPLAYGVFVVLIGMFLLLTWADLVRPVTL